MIRIDIVDPGGQACINGLVTGDIVSHFDGLTLVGNDHFSEILSGNSDKEFVLTIFRNGAPFEVVFDGAKKLGIRVVDVPARESANVAEEIDRYSKARAVVVTTGFFIHGKEIEREIDVISAECVYGMNIFRDLFVAVRDAFGGRSQSIQKVLREARQTVLTELRKEAVSVGADAVIGVDLDYQEFSGYKDGGMIMLVASGTAVKTK